VGRDARPAVARAFIDTRIQTIDGGGTETTKRDHRRDLATAPRVFR